MDGDGLILNLVDDVQPEAIKRPGGSKGGRWTERVKQKRFAKRKNGPGVRNSTATARDAEEDPVDLEESPRPSKRSRTNTQPEMEPESGGRAAKPSNRSSQIVSSLFTSNPEVKIDTSHPPAHRVSKPSNAPLADTSTFAGLGLDALIINHLEKKMGITKPTAIQREALKPLLRPEPSKSEQRDIFIQSQTGSGKTLSYLLPIIQDLLPLSSLSYIDRSIGTLAVIIVPTRELAKQISDVLEMLLTMRLRPPDESADDTGSARLTRWLVSGLLTGGATRTHEKARLRKGLPILVATPGRLLDHLQNTTSCNLGKCRWLVLDEADRLMELGFEETIKGILNALDGRRKLALQAVQEGTSTEVGGWDWGRRRRTLLCSATISEDVQHLAGTALENPLFVKGHVVEKPFNTQEGVPTMPEATSASEERFTPPSQLAQKHVVVPLKLRLVTLVALLRSILAQSKGSLRCKIIVFLSCTDSVDYHWRLLGQSSIDESGDASESGSESDEADENNDSDKKMDHKEHVALQSPLLPDTTIYRLHGSLALSTRLASLKGFSSAPKEGKEGKSSTARTHPFSILLCTSVASRGLDLPLVRAVVQYDLPTEGGATEYVHRVGRTARAGKGGEAWSFVSPSEQAWVPWIEQRINGPGNEDSRGDGEKASLGPVSVDSVLRGGFGGKGKEYEDRATQVQLSFERWVLKHSEHGALARQAFRSHMRAYATHPSDEKHIFHVRHLHIGHMAKAFALREAPSHISQQKQKEGKKTKGNVYSKHQVSLGNEDSNDMDTPRKGTAKSRAQETNAEKRMRDVVRRQGRLSKKGGVMMTTGTSEFQLAGTADLERLVSGGKI